MSTSCFKIFLSKQFERNFLYVKFLCDRLVIMLEISVLGLRPKCASNGLVLVVALGISLMFSIIFATLWLNVVCVHLESMTKTARLRFIVCISLSIIPVPLWTPAGASVNYMFFFLQHISNFLALKACA